MPAEGMQRRGGRQPVEQEAAAQPLNGQTRATQDSAAPCPSAAAPWWPADANGPVLALHLAGGMAVVMGHLVVAGERCGGSYWL